MKILKISCFVTFICIFFFNSSFAKNPTEFIKKLTTDASKILASNLSKEEKQNQLKNIASKSVDIRGIGFYTLGKYRKSLSDDQKKKYTDMIQTLIEEYNYNEASAEEILTYASNNLWRDS